MPEETPIQFPNYEPPKQGIPLMSHPGQAKPLTKVIRRMMKAATPKSGKGRGFSAPPRMRGRPRKGNLY